MTTMGPYEAILAETAVGAQGEGHSTKSKLEAPLKMTERLLSKIFSCLRGRVEREVWTCVPRVCIGESGEGRTSKLGLRAPLSNFRLKLTYYTSHISRIETQSGRFITKINTVQSMLQFISA